MPPRLLRGVGVVVVVGVGVRAGVEGCEDKGVGMSVVAGVDILCVWSVAIIVDGVIVVGEDVDGENDGGLMLELTGASSSSTLISSSGVSTSVSRPAEVLPQLMNIFPSSSPA